MRVLLWLIAKKLRDTHVLLTESHLVLFYYDRWPLLPNCYANTSDRHFVLNQSHILPSTMTYSIYMDRFYAQAPPKRHLSIDINASTPVVALCPPTVAYHSLTNGDSEDGIIINVPCRSRKYYSDLTLSAFHLLFAIRMVDFNDPAVIAQNTCAYAFVTKLGSSGSPLNPLSRQ